MHHQSRTQLKIKSTTCSPISAVIYFELTLVEYDEGNLQRRFSTPNDFNSELYQQQNTILQARLKMTQVKRQWTISMAGDPIVTIEKYNKYENLQDEDETFGETK